VNYLTFSCDKVLYFEMTVYRYRSRRRRKPGEPMEGVLGVATVGDHRDTFQKQAPKQIG
jgi:hypothetical protein